MTVSMISCPACRTMLFSDTVICPACRHVLDAERAALLDDADDLAKSRSEQIVCRACGEANQIGLVRCWNCSSFLREDIQEAYFQMLRSQREVIYSQPSSYAEGSRVESSPQSDRDAYDGDDDDFELSGSYSLKSPEERDPESSGTYQLTGEAPAPPSSNGSGSPSTPKDPPASSASEAKPESQQDAPEQDSQKHRRRPEDNPDAEDHSVATGGDVLLDIALKEEAEAEKIRKRREAAIQRKQQKRKKGRSQSEAETAGEAPSPERLAAQKKALARRKAAKMRAEENKKKSEQKFGFWLSDVRLHKINPHKLKLKPGSEEKQFELVDVGCSSSGIVVALLTKKPGFTLFSKPKSNPEETRKEVRAHLEAGKAIKELPAPEHDFFEGEALGQIKVVQPVVYVHESMFAGVPVFGEGRIAVRLPVKADVPEQRFLSFWLTDFRKFSQALEQLLGIKDLGHLEGVPLTDPILNLTCHYSEVPLKAIDPEAIKLYQADPQVTLELIGRRCESCGLAVSEDARRKEKIGGLKGNAIAKAKCPKCEKKFGSISLFRIAGSDKKPVETESSPPDSE